MPPIIQTPCQTLRKSQLLIQLPNQKQTRIRADRTALEVHRQISLDKKRKQSLFTLCHFQSLRVGLFIINSDYSLEAFLSA
jgi:hypothetical protein